MVGWKIATLLLQLRVLRLGFLQDGNVGVGVFPEGEEIRAKDISVENGLLYLQPASASNLFQPPPLLILGPPISLSQHSLAARGMAHSFRNARSGLTFV